MRVLRLGVAIGMLLLANPGRAAWVVPAVTKKNESVLRRRLTTVAAASVNTSTSPDGSTLLTKQQIQQQQQYPLTTALLQISYDGSRFTGWSAGNDKNNNTVLSNMLEQSSGRGAQGAKQRRRRNRNSGGFVRSVQGVLQTNLAKIYGNIDPSRIVVEGCSRTDKDVHAAGMVVQFYCLTETAAHQATTMKMVQQQTDESTATTAILKNPGHQPSIPGKRLPHPWNSTDTSCFEVIPKTLSQLAFALNRMSVDVQIMAYAPTPTTTSQQQQPFHPTLASKSKTYRFLFSIGPMRDPTQYHRVWHIRHDDTKQHYYQDWSSKPSVLEACACLQGRHNFSSFQGVCVDDKRKRTNKKDPICTLESVALSCRSKWQNTTTYELQVTGDRFLYKMMRFLAGAVVAVGQDKLTVDDLKSFLNDTKVRTNEWECAPAHALTLCEVHYDEHKLELPIEWEAATS